MGERSCLSRFKVKNMKTKPQKVKGYTYRKRNGKKVTVKAHTRTVKDETVPITKKQYEGRFKKQAERTQRADKSRRKRNTLTGKTNKLKPGWNPKKTDWENVDAPAFPTIRKEQVIKVLRGSIPANYKIIKYWIKSKATGKKLTRYRPTYQGKNIGGVRAYTTLKTAQRICKVHEGRRTGKIKNVSQEAAFYKELHSPTTKRGSKQYAGPAWKDPRETDYGIDWEAEDDSSLSYSERMAERKEKKRRGYGAFDY